MSKPSDRMYVPAGRPSSSNVAMPSNGFSIPLRARQRPLLSAQEFAGAVECAIGKVLVNAQPHVVLTASAEGWFLCMDGEVADYVPTRIAGLLALVDLADELSERGADAHLRILDDGVWRDFGAAGFDDQTVDPPTPVFATKNPSEPSETEGTFTDVQQHLIEALGASVARARASVDAAIEAVERSEARFAAAEFFAAKIQDAPLE